MARWGAFALKEKKKCRSLSSSLCSFLHSTVTSSLIGPDILLNTLFPNPLSLRVIGRTASEMKDTWKYGRTRL